MGENGALWRGCEGEGHGGVGGDGGGGRLREREERWGGLEMKEMHDMLDAMIAESVALIGAPEERRPVQQMRQETSLRKRARLYEIGHRARDMEKCSLEDIVFLIRLNGDRCLTGTSLLVTPAMLLL